VKVYEAHLWLASSLGDSIIVDDINGIIPDGVRYSKDLRDSYLYRAMLDIYKKAIERTVILSKQIASQVIYYTFPNMIKELLTNPLQGNNLNLDIFDYKPLYIISIEATDLNDDSTYPIPVRDHYKGVYLKNSRNVQNHDAFCTLVSLDDKTLLNYYDALNLTCELTINYIPYPKPPVDWETNMDMEFEEKHVPAMLAKAASYGLADSQDIQNQETFLRLTMEENSNANQ